MKKIGILYGHERTFPMAFIEAVNGRNVRGILAEPVIINKVIQGEAAGYSVILDRISPQVPFYRAYLKNAALSGTAVINNPFWNSADEKFFDHALATKIGVPVPKTVLLPSREMPADTMESSFSNLAYPLDWESIFRYTGFPAYMKPAAGGGKMIYRIAGAEDFYQKHSETGRQAMLLQEEILYEEYYRCYCIGARDVHILPYDPGRTGALRYAASFSPPEEKLRQMEQIVIRINEFLGYDFNCVDIALRNGIPYAIDCCNPVPEAEKEMIGEDAFNWLVETAANYAIGRALDTRMGLDNLTWGEYLKKSMLQKPLMG